MFKWPLSLKILYVHELLNRGVWAGAGVSGPCRHAPPNHWPPVTSTPAWPSPGLLLLSRDVFLLFFNTFQKLNKESFPQLFLSILKFFSEITTIQDQAPSLNLKIKIFGP